MLSYTLAGAFGLQPTPLEIAERRLGKSAAAHRHRRLSTDASETGDLLLSAAEDASPSSSSPLTLRPGFPTAVPTILEEEDEDATQIDLKRHKRRLQEQLRKANAFRDDVALNGDATSDESSTF